MNYLTWAMLKERIEQMSEYEQQQPVMAWGDEMPLKKGIILCNTDEDMYYNDDFDCCYPESELDDYAPADCELVTKKGTYYLDIS